MKQWFPLAGLMLAAFIFNTSEFIPIGLLSDIAADFGISESHAGMMITIYAWVVAIASLLLMLVFARTESKKLMLSIVTPLAVRMAPEGRSATALSLIVSGSSFAMIVGLPLGRTVGLYVGWRTTFLIIAAAAALIFCVLALTLFGVVGIGAGALVGGSVCDGAGIRSIGYVGGAIALAAVVLMINSQRRSRKMSVI